MTNLLFAVAVPVLLLNLRVVPAQVQSSVSNTPRITVDCEHCSNETRTQLKKIAAGIVQAEDSACFRNYFADHPPTEVETRVAVGDADICGKDGVTVTPKTTLLSTHDPLKQSKAAGLAPRWRRGVLAFCVLLILTFFAWCLTPVPSGLSGTDASGPTSSHQE